MLRSGIALVILLCVVAAMGVISSPACGGQPSDNYITVYGWITAPGGGTAAPDGLYLAQVRIYDAPTGGNMLWSEWRWIRHRGLHFHLLLGQATAFSLPCDRQYWLALRHKYGSSDYFEQELRFAVATAAYAVNAAKVDGFHASATPTPNYLLPLNANGKIPISVIEGTFPADDDWTISGSDIYRTTGNVGIGTSTPGARLDAVASTGIAVRGAGTGAGGYFSDSNSSGYAYVGYGDYGVEGRGNGAGGHFRDSNGSGYAYVGKDEYGIQAWGNTVGGYFKDGNGSGEAWAGYGDTGVHAEGNTQGGYFSDSDGSGNARVGYGDQGIFAQGDSMGGGFYDGDGTSQAYLAYGERGIEAQGDDMGGYFSDADGSGIARVGYGDYGVHAQGTTAGGYFVESDGDSFGYVGYGACGVYAEGNVLGGCFAATDGSGGAYIGMVACGVQAWGNAAGGWFQDADGSSLSYLAYGERGIEAQGDEMGGYFHDTADRSYAYVADGDWGIQAWGNTGGGYFKDGDGSGTAMVGYGDCGIEAYGNGLGGYFQDLDSGVYLEGASGTSSTAGNGTKDFVQNHPIDPDKVIVYKCLEGDEAATYTRGTARLIGGIARVPLGETFKWVTNPDVGLTAHLTPRGVGTVLYVESLTTEEMVVRSMEGFPADLVFDYIVYGLRIGFEEVSVVRDKVHEAPIPSMAEHEELYQRYPELRGYNALERFIRMEAEAGEVEPLDLSDSSALRQAVGEFDPAVQDGPRLEGPPVRR
jgi:hypothetical protein